MRRAVLTLAPLLFGLAAAWGAQDKQDPPKPATPAAEAYQALVAEVNKLQTEYVTAIRAATTNEERQKVFQEKYPNPQKYAARFFEIAEKHPKDPAAVDCLVWIVQRAPQGQEGTKALELLSTEHIANPKMAQVAPILSRNPNGEKLLRAVLEKNPDREAKGQACFALAQILHRGSSSRDGKFDEAKAKEAEQLFEEVTKAYADVKTGRGTLGDAAKSTLFEVRHLSVGKTVPEIEADDTDGKKFKLSDYRGKVVMIDFWGHW